MKPAAQPDSENLKPAPGQVSGLGFQVFPPPWFVLAAAVTALVIQFFPAWREALLYVRPAVADGEFWRIWTGHLVHFGWPHFLVDAGLLLAVGWFAEQRHPRFTRGGLVLMPAFISGCLYWLEPDLVRYGGLSAVNLGLLLYVALTGWARDRREWFWPAVIAAYAAELLFEHLHGGQGGGTIRFDDPGIRVATGAHLAAAAYALLSLGVTRLANRPGRAPA